MVLIYPNPRMFTDCLELEAVWFTDVLVISVPSYMVSYTRRWKGIFISLFLYHPVR